MSDDTHFLNVMVLIAIKQLIQFGSSTKGIWLQVTGDEVMALHK